MKNADYTISNSLFLTTRVYNIKSIEGNEAINTNEFKFYDFLGLGHHIRQ